jgi:hypothetical protein
MSLFHQSLPKIAILLLLLLPFASAFNQFTTIQIISKAFPDNNCPQKLLDGINATYDGNFIAAYPELQPENLQCDNNTICKAQASAHDWFQLALQSQNGDPCTQAFYLGVASKLYTLTQDPANIKGMHPNCQNDFYTKLDQTLSGDQNIFTIKGSCTLSTGIDYNINYNTIDYNNTINNLRIQWQTQKPETQIPSIEGGIPAYQTDIAAWIKNAVDNGKPETIPASALSQIWDLSCLYTQDRKMDYYKKWGTLDNTARQCLSYFANSPAEGTNFINFANCPYIYKDDRGEYYWWAMYTLEAYTQKGFAEKTCNQMSIPTQFLQGNQVTTGNPLMSQFCIYKPLKISQGCIEEFKAYDDWQTGGWNSGFAVGGTAIFLLIITILGAKMFLDTAG